MMRRLLTKAAGLAIGAAALTGCHLDMWQQRRYEPLESGAFFGFSDGRVQFINQNLDINTFRLLSSINDGLPLGEFEGQ